MSMSDDIKAMVGIDVCEHGHLARKCEVCDLKAEVHQLREAVKVLAVGIAPLVGATDGDDICLTWDGAENVRIAMANPIAAAAVREAGR